MVGQDFFKLLRFMTLFALILTAFGKTAAGFRIDRRGNFAFKNDAFSSYGEYPSRELQR